MVTAVIFDMDGVLVDGEPLHFNAAREILADEGHVLDRALYQRYLGRTGTSIWDDMRERFGLTISLKDYQRRYDATVLELYRTQARPMPGARALLERLRAAAVLCALASSSKREWVETALGALRFGGYFRATVSGDEVRQGKPDPEIYRRAAAALGVAPAACLAIEDAPAGIESAHRAGMRVIGVRTELTEGLTLNADRVIDSLAEFDLEWLQEGAAHG